MDLSKIPFTPENFWLWFYLRLLWCLIHNCSLSEIYFFSFYFLFLAVCWILLFYSQSAISWLIVKGGLSQVLMVTQAGRELCGWSLGPFFSDFSFALSHPGGFFVIYSFLPPFTIKKKKSSISWCIFGCRITPDGTFCIGKKNNRITEFRELSSYFQF